MGPGRPFCLSFLALAQTLPWKVYFYSLYKSDKEVFSAPISVAIKVSHFPEFFSFRTGIPISPGDPYLHYFPSSSPFEWNIFGSRGQAGSTSFFSRWEREGKEEREGKQCPLPSFFPSFSTECMGRHKFRLHFAPPTFAMFLKSDDLPPPSRKLHPVLKLHNDFLWAYSP